MSSKSDHTVSLLQSEKTRFLCIPARKAVVSYGSAGGEHRRKRNWILIPTADTHHDSDVTGVVNNTLFWVSGNSEDTQEIHLRDERNISKHLPCLRVRCTKPSCLLSEASSAAQGNPLTHQLQRKDSYQEFEGFHIFLPMPSLSHC